MCGHVGIAGKLEFKDEAMFKRLLLLDYFRGPDSTGVAIIDKVARSSKVVKMASHPLDLFDSSKFKAALSAYSASAFIGHNRAATKGAVSSINAHPFEHGHIVGCHNGTLSVPSFAAIEKALGERYEVDSDAIFASIAKLGVKATLDMMQGAWALVWVDYREGTLNFLRNKERPFWYAYSKEFDHLFWASEWPMIDAANKLGGSYDLFVEEKTGYKFWQTPTDIHLKYDLAALQKGGTERPKPLAVERKGKEPAPVLAVVGGSDPFQRTGGATPSTTTSTTTRRGNSGSASAEADAVTLYGDDEEPFAGYYTKAQFEAMAKYGCSWCGADVAFGDVGVTVMERDETVLCKGCSCGDQTESRVFARDLAAVKQFKLI